MHPNTYPLAEGKKMNPLGCMFNPLMATCILYSYTWLPSIYILPWLLSLQNTPYLFNLELCKEKEKKGLKKEKDSSTLWSRRANFDTIPCFKRVPCLKTLNGLKIGPSPVYTKHCCHFHNVLKGHLITMKIPLLRKGTFSISNVH
jgi:hypothetical protein